MDKILILLLGLLAVCVAFLVFAYNQKSKLAEKKVKENFEDNEEPPAKVPGAEYFEEDDDETGVGRPTGAVANAPPAKVPVGAEHFSGYREHFEEDPEPDCSGCPGADDCGQRGCPTSENFSGYREHFEEDPEPDCSGCPGADDCGQRGCPTSENFCGSGSCFQEGFRSGNFSNSYRKPAGEEFFQGYGIESFVNGGNNFTHFDEHFEEEQEQEQEQESEHYENYNYVREDFESEPLTLKLFYADWCGHCTRFKPTFDNELPELIRRTGMRCKLEAINADKQPDMVKQYGVKGFPTMILEKNGRVIEYNGDRTVSDIEKFISKNL